MRRVQAALLILSVFAGTAEAQVDSILKDALRLQNEADYGAAADKLSAVLSGWAEPELLDAWLSAETMVLLLGRSDPLLRLPKVDARLAGLPAELKSTPRVGVRRRLLSAASILVSAQGADAVIDAAATASEQVEICAKSLPDDAALAVLRVAILRRTATEPRSIESNAAEKGLLAKAVIKNPDVAALRLMAAEAALASGDAAAAEAQCTELLVRAPKLVSALRVRAEARRRQEKLVPALADLDRAIDLRRDGIDSWIARSALRLEAERIDDAVNDGLYAVANAPLERTAHEALARAYLVRGDHRKAFESFAAAVALADGSAGERAPDVERSGAATTGRTATIVESVFAEACRDLGVEPKPFERPALRVAERETAVSASGSHERSGPRPTEGVAEQAVAPVVAKLDPAKAEAAYRQWLLLAPYASMSNELFLEIITAARVKEAFGRIRGYSEMTFDAHETLAMVGPDLVRYLIASEGRIVPIYRVDVGRLPSSLEEVAAAGLVELLSRQNEKNVLRLWQTEYDQQARYAAERLLPLVRAFAAPVDAAAPAPLIRCSRSGDIGVVNTTQQTWTDVVLVVNFGAYDGNSSRHHFFVDHLAPGAEARLRTAGDWPYGPLGTTEGTVEVLSRTFASPPSAFSLPDNYLSVLHQVLVPLASRRPGVVLRELEVFRRRARDSKDALQEAARLEAYAKTRRQQLRTEIEGRRTAAQRSLEAARRESTRPHSVHESPAAAQRRRESNERKRRAAEQKVAAIDKELQALDK